MNFINFFGFVLLLSFFFLNSTKKEGNIIIHESPKISAFLVDEVIMIIRQYSVKSPCMYLHVITLHKTKYFRNRTQPFLFKFMHVFVLSVNKDFGALLAFAVVNAKFSSPRR